MSFKRAGRFLGLGSLILIAVLVIAACGSNQQEQNEAPGTLPQTGSSGITGTNPFSSTSPLSGTSPLTSTATMTPSTGVSPTTGVTSTGGISSTTGMTNEITIELTAQNNQFHVIAITNTAESTMTGGLSGAAGSSNTGTMSSTTGLTASEPITVTAGAHVVVKFTNLDSVPHNLAVYSDKSLKTKIYVGKIITGPNTTMTYDFFAPSTPGTYYYQCDVHPTMMYGDFVVEAATNSSTSTP